MGKVTVELTGDEARLLRSLDKIIDKEKKLARAAGEVGRKSARGAKEATGGLRGMVGKLGAAAAGYLSLAAAVGIFKKVLAEANAERKRAAGGLAAGESGIRGLVQLARDKQDLQKMQGAARATRSQAGVGQDAASNLQFQLRSLDMAKDRKLFASLYDITKSTEAPGQLAVGVKKLQENLGIKETGTSRAVLNKMLRASRGSPVAAEQLAGPMAQVAQVVSRLGGGDEELLAAIATMAKATESPETAATQLGAFAQAARKKGFKGKGIMEAVSWAGEKLKGKSEAQRIKWFGRKEGEKGYSLLHRQRGEIGSLTGALYDVGASTGRGDYIQQLLDLAAGDPALAALKANRVAGQRKKIAEEQGFGTAEQRRQAIIKAAGTGSINAGEDPYRRALRQGELYVRSWFGQSPEGLAEAAIPEYDRQAREIAREINALPGLGIQVDPNTGDAVDTLRDAAMDLKAAAGDMGLRTR